MPSGSYERKMFDGGVTQASLQTGIDDTQLTLTVGSGQGASFPDGSSGKFVIALGLGTSTEEKILVTSRSVDVFTLSTRGYDDTTGNSHLAGVTINHVLDASTIDQANRYVNLQANKGDLVAHDGTNAQAVPVGANDEFLVADSTQTNGVAYKSTTDLNLATTAYVTTAIGDEESARIASDTTLQDNIDNETSARTSADSALDTRVTSLEGTDITVTFGTGSDLSGSFTITNLSSVTNTSVAVRDGSHSHTTANIDSFAENVQDIVGAMVSGNTESNITVTYQDSDGTLDFSVDDVYMKNTGDTSSGTMRVTSSLGSTAGFIVENTTNVSGTACRGVLVQLGNDGTNTTDNDDYVLFRRGDGTEVGGIRGTGGTSVQYDTSSDYRLKTNLNDIHDGLDKVRALSPKYGQWISQSDPDKIYTFWIAHELQEYLPDVVSGTKDSIDENGNPEYQAVDYGKLSPILAAAIKDLDTLVSNQQTVINSLIARIETLENS